MGARAGAGEAGRDRKEAMATTQAAAGGPPKRQPRRSGAGTAGRTAKSAARPPFPAHQLMEDLRLAFVSRAMDDREITLKRQSRSFFQISGAGHELILLALARSLEPGRDWFFPYYRDRALMLGLGVSPYEMLLQAVGSSSDPASAGRQMPSHWGFSNLNIVTQSSPTGSQCLPAVGCAEGSAYLAEQSGERPELTYVSLGEGAASEGEFWESLNAACLHHLPVLFLVADNGFAISVRSEDQAPAPISELVSSFPGLGVSRVDGSDYLACRKLGEQAVEHIRAGGGPYLIHADVIRPYSHSSDDSQTRYRAVAELEAEEERDPLRSFAGWLVSMGICDESEVAAIKAAAFEEVAEAAAKALEAPRPDPTTVVDQVWDLRAVTQNAAAPATPAAPADDVAPGTAVNMGDAIRQTLTELMEADERIRVFGEDVADAPPSILGEVRGKGGVFGTTLGLQRRFGVSRCYNTPLAEAGIIGRAVGQAIRGLRPCPEIQFFDYIWPAMQQLRSEAATIRWRSNGAFVCPMVVRVAIGGYLTGGAIWHSQCGESIFAHIPGLMVAFPSRAADAAGLLRTAFDAEDPVLFLEHKHLYRQPYARDVLPGPGHRIPFGKAATVRDGSDLFIVTYGATVERSKKAAETLEREQGLSIGVLDLRTIAPWDQEAVADVVKKTGRLLVVHEDTMTAGFGAEIAAWVSSECFSDLDAPVQRVAAKDANVPYEPSLERAMLPQVEDVVEAAFQLAMW